MRDLSLNEPPICAKCEEEFIFDDDMTAPRYCDPCAHERVSELEMQMKILLQSLSDAGIEVVDGKVASRIVPTDRLQAIAADDFCEFPECSTHEPKIGICVACDAIYAAREALRLRSILAPPTGSAEEVKP